MLFSLRSVINLYFERTKMCTHRLLLVEHYFREPLRFRKQISLQIALSTKVQSVTKYYELPNFHKYVSTIAYY